MLKECSANYAGDGPTKRVDSLILNGIEIKKIKSRFYITAINNTILCQKFPDNIVHVGNEVRHYLLANIEDYLRKTCSYLYCNRLFKSIVCIANI